MQGGERLRLLPHSPPKTLVPHTAPPQNPNPQAKPLLHLLHSPALEVPAPMRPKTLAHSWLPLAAPLAPNAFPQVPPLNVSVLSLTYRFPMPWPPCLPPRGPQPPEFIPGNAEQILILQARHLLTSCRPRHPCPSAFELTQASVLPAPPNQQKN